MTAVAKPVIVGLIVGFAFVMLFSSLFTNLNPSNKTVLDFAEKRQSDMINMDFLMVPSAVELGATVDFVVRITGTISGCDIPPHASIRDLSNNATVWDTGESFTLCLSDPDAPPRQVNIDWYGGRYYIENGIHYNYSSPLMVAKSTGDYELTVDYRGVNASKKFIVIEHEQQLAEGLPRYILSAANRTFDIPYSLSGEHAMIQAIKPDFQHFNLSIEVVGIDANSTMTVVLPKEMLKEMEIASGYHYCVGNDFAVFVNDENVSAYVKDADMAEILTFPVLTGSNSVYIAGTDMLEYIPHCD